MTIYYRDELGTIAVEVNEYGVDFDHTTQRAIFEDIDGKKYAVPISEIIGIAPHAIIPLF